jgi:hypothetical protein
MTDDYTIVRFRLLNKNWEMLHSAAELTGDNLETVLNRATALYETLHRVEPGTLVKWDDQDGTEHSLLVLPSRLPMPWFLRWLKVEIGRD